jgi:hypothetical protein
MLPEQAFTCAVAHLVLGQHCRQTACSAELGLASVETGGAEEQWAAAVDFTVPKT